MSEPKKMTWAELELEFDPAVRTRIREARRVARTDGMAYLRCIVMDSSRFGDKTALRYGPECTFKSVAEITARTCGVYVTGLPSSAAACEGFTEDQAPDGPYVWDREDVIEFVQHLRRAPKALANTVKMLKDRAARGEKGKIYAAKDSDGNLFVVSYDRVLHAEGPVVPDGLPVG